MKINVNQTLKTIIGEVLKDNDGQGNAIDATLKMAIVNALLAPLPQGKQESGTDKVKKWKLATKVYETDEVDFDENDIKLIKDRVGEVYPPLIVGQVFDLLKV